MPPKQRASHSSSKRGTTGSKRASTNPGSRSLHSASTKTRHGAPDHPHFFTQGRSGGGQGTGLRHDSSRSRAPDHITSGHSFPGSQSIAEDMHHLQRHAHNSAFDSPGEHMHRATLEHNRAQRPEMDEFGYNQVRPNNWSLNDIPSQDPMEAHNNRIRREVEFDYYEREPREGGIKFPEPPTRQQNQRPKVEDFHYQNIGDQQQESFTSYGCGRNELKFLSILNMMVKIGKIVVERTN
jgi:hypothetical protein